uniref:Uncharacterized protein n=1 Tax=Romanomermis culicivorax TaxID=13658 RepID=A0A915IPQ0_ROMCU
MTSCEISAEFYNPYFWMCRQQPGFSGKASYNDDMYVIIDFSSGSETSTSKNISDNRAKLEVFELEEKPAACR